MVVSAFGYQYYFFKQQFNDMTTWDNTTAPGLCGRVKGKRTCAVFMRTSFRYFDHLTGNSDACNLLGRRSEIAVATNRQRNWDPTFLKACRIKGEYWDVGVKGFVGRNVCDAMYNMHLRVDTACRDQKRTKVHTP